MYVCMYMCVYVCIYIYIYIHTSIIHTNYGKARYEITTAVANLYGAWLSIDVRNSGVCASNVYV